MPLFIATKAGGILIEDSRYSSGRIKHVSFKDWNGGAVFIVPDCPRNYGIVLPFDLESLLFVQLNV